MKQKWIRCIKELHYRFYSCVNRIVPKDRNMIFIYDNQLMRQNCWALFRYLVEHGYTEKYKVVYYAKKDKTRARFADRHNVVITDSLLQGWWSNLRAKHVFFEYDNYKFTVRPARGQICFQMWHAMPLKKIGYLQRQPAHPYEQDYSYILATSDFFAPLMQQAFGCSDAQTYVGGSPRNDQLVGTAAECPFIRKDCRNVLWMPTFRKSSANNFVDSSVTFPILREEIMESFDAHLRSRNMHLLIKLHPLQDRIDWLYDGKFTNITLLTNQDIFDSGLELYEFVGQTDALITDYSSIFYDYLLTEKPLIFAMDDYKEYGQNRGFVIDNYADMLPGPIVATYEEFVSAMDSVGTDDPYREKRLEMKEKLMPDSRSGSFSKDMLDFLGLVL